jgi:tetratricopeptide (TPR) repeat protein
MLNGFFRGQAGIMMLCMSRLVSLALGRNKVPRSGGILVRLVTLLLASWGQLAAQGAASQTAISETVRAHFSAAQVAQQRGDYAAAEREYRAILAEAPNFAEVHMNLGLLYQLQDRTPEAMAEFRRALKVKPTLAGANFFLGVNYCKNGDGAKAIPYLKAASRQELNRTDIWSWLATAQEISGDSQAEVTTLKHALSVQPRDADMLYLLGHAYERLAKQEVTRLEKASPASFWSEQLLAESYSSSTQWSFAVIRFQNALTLSPNRPGLHVRLGEVFLRAGRVDQAAQEFEQELQIDANNLRAIVRRGEVKLIQGDIDAALKDWTRALNMDRPRTERVLGIHEIGFLEAAVEQLPDSLRQQIQALAPQLRERHDAAGDLALAFLAAQNGSSMPEDTEAASTKAAPLAKTCVEREVRAALDAGQYSSVSGCFLRVLTPNSSRDLRIQVAQALFELGEYESALKALSGPVNQQYPPAYYWRARCFAKLATQAYFRLYQADPNSYRVHQLMGDLEAAKANDGKAIEEYRTAVAMKPSVPNLHYSLGHLLWKDLKTDEARKEFNAELELNPRHAGALHDLGTTYLLEHQPEKALAYLTRALEADPGDPDIHRDLGTAYAELHEYAKAEAEFKAAIPADHDGSVHYKLARIYQAQGQKESAAREFEISTSLNRESHAKLEKQTERINQIEGASSPHP